MKSFPLSLLMRKGTSSFSELLVYRESKGVDEKFFTQQNPKCPASLLISSYFFTPGNLFLCN